MIAIEQIKAPIKSEFEAYEKLFDQMLQHEEEPQNSVFQIIKSRAGKRLRPIVTLLLAKALGDVNPNTLYSAVALELLHTASLVHDDVVDNSDQRRGAASVRAENGNKIAVLLGDYILSTALLSIAQTNEPQLVKILSTLGRTLTDGEILQLKNDTKMDVSHETYYKIIEGKTASLFKACCEIGARTATTSVEMIEKALLFGKYIGLIFQIRDDIFDYIPSKELGKPAAKDMRERKLTLPALYILNRVGESGYYYSIAQKVKDGSISDEEISDFIDYIVKNGGIDYAEEQIEIFAKKAHSLIDELTKKEDANRSLHLLVDFFSERDY